MAADANDGTRVRNFRIQDVYLDSKMAKMPEDRPSPPSRPKKK